MLPANARAYLTANRVLLKVKSHCFLVFIENGVRTVQTDSAIRFCLERGDLVLIQCGIPAIHAIYHKRRMLLRG